MFCLASSGQAQETLTPHTLTQAPVNTSVPVPTPLTRAEVAQITPVEPSNLDASGVRSTPAGWQVYKEKNFAAEILAMRETINIQAAHFVFLVDVTDTVGDLLLSKWRNDLYGYLLSDFFVESKNDHAGDFISVIPFTRDADLAPAITQQLRQDYSYRRQANLKQLFPSRSNTNTPVSRQGTDLDKALQDVLAYSQEQKWPIQDNLVIILITDDIQQKPAASNSSPLNALYSEILHSYPNRSLRYIASFDQGRAKERLFSVYLYSNSFPDKSTIFSNHSAQTTDRNTLVNVQKKVHNSSVTPSATPRETPGAPYQGEPSPGWKLSDMLWPLLAIAGLLCLGLLWTDYNGAQYLIDYHGTRKTVYVRRGRNKKQTGIHNPYITGSQEFIGAIKVVGNGLLRSDHIELHPHDGYVLRLNQNHRTSKLAPVDLRSDARGAVTQVYFEHPERKKKVADSNLSSINDSLFSGTNPGATDGSNDTTDDAVSGAPDIFGTTNIPSQDTKPPDAGVSSLLTDPLITPPQAPVSGLGLNLQGNPTASTVQNTPPQNPYQGQLRIAVTRRRGLTFPRSQPRSSGQQRSASKTKT